MKTHLFALLLLILGTKVLCRKRIVGGVPAATREWPFIVSLRFGRTDFPFCGGSLITREWVLTAAHCFADGMFPELYRVNLGSYDLYPEANSTVQRINVTELYIHPLFNETTLDYDIGLMKLAKPVDLTGSHAKIAVTVDAKIDGLYPKGGTPCFTAGWGDTKNTGSDAILRQVDVPTIDLADCRKLYRKHDEYITFRMICAGHLAGGKDSCQGDSGGPLVCDIRGNGIYLLTGIVSWGLECAQPELAGVYANIALLQSWYLDIINASNKVGVSSITAAFVLIRFLV